ncbi:MAG: 50S ribosomal protein L1 [Proteobacteria bacterium]|nr:50S ribosomal protein L1 [Pseudomonadota bacterium]
MSHKGKNYRAARAKIDPAKRYTLEEGIGLLKEVAKARFPETVEVAIRLGVDPTKADQMVRGTVKLPHGTGKKVRILVFAKGEKEEEAKKAGADHVGADSLISKIRDENWLDFDLAIATPDMMGAVGKLGKILGPKGLMPNPKSGTVTFDVGKTVNEFKGGRVEFRVDKAGNVHVPVGKINFEPQQLKENILSLMEMVNSVKPATSKGIYLKGVSLSSTMSPGVRILTSTLARGV